MSDDVQLTYGTADRDAPVTRRDFERALRHLNMSDMDLRDGVLQVMARVIALTDELVRRVDRVEPEPAPPNTPAATPTDTIEIAVARTLGAAVRTVRAHDAAQPTRVVLDTGGDKYAVEPSSPPCEELLHLCKARCCKMTFALSTADLDEGVIRFDYGQPYLIRQRASDGYCVHCEPTKLHCTVHAQRPRACRKYDCRDDKRIWIDYAQRIPAPAGAKQPTEVEASFDLIERAIGRSRALGAEKRAIAESFADADAKVGPR